METQRECREPDARPAITPRQPGSTRQLGAPALQGARQDPRADAYTDRTKRLHSLVPLTTVCPYQRSNILNHCRVLP